MHAFINVAELIGLIAIVGYGVARLQRTGPTGTGLDVLPLRRR